MKEEKPQSLELIGKESLDTAKEIIKKTISVLQKNNKISFPVNRKSLDEKFLTCPFSYEGNNFFIIKDEGKKFSCLALYQTKFKKYFSPQNIVEGFVVKIDAGIDKFVLSPSVQIDYKNADKSRLSDNQETLEKIDLFLNRFKK